MEKFRLSEETDNVVHGELPELRNWMRSIKEKMSSAIERNGFHGFAMPVKVREELKAILGLDAKMCQVTTDCVKVHGRIVALFADLDPKEKASDVNHEQEAA